MHPDGEIHRFYERRRNQWQAEATRDTQIPTMDEAQGVASDSMPTEAEEREMVQTLFTTQPRIAQALDKL